MARDCSMNNEAPVVSHSHYIPRNAVDHMNPFFYKGHRHSHGYHDYTHSHSQHLHHDQSHHHQHHASRPQPYPHPNQPSNTPPSTSSSRSPSSSLTSLSSPPSLADLETPLPRHLPAHIDPNTNPSYNTPPATPPLTLLQNQAQVTATSTASAAVASGSTEPDDPLAWCTARARIPTPDGSEYFLLIYENKLDKKEHLAFVFSDSIRSRSLDKVQPGETEMDRIKRGAYLGRLQPSTTAVQDQNQCNLAATATTATTATAMTMTTTSVVEMVVDQEQGPSTVMEVEDNMAVTLSASSTTSLSKPLAPLVRIHSECFTGEIGHSARCDCGEQLDEAIRLMKAEGSGVVVYLRQEGRGIGLGEKLKAYNLQDLGYDTVMANLLLNHGADERTYEVAQAILLDLGLDEIRLLTNNPDKIEQVELSSNIKVVERVPMVPKSWEAIVQGTQGDLEVKEGAVENKIVKGKELDRYLKVKVERMRHLISIPTSL